MSRHTFQPLSDVELALMDLVRVGAGGNGAGVRQLANRLARKPPSGVANAGEFRAALGTALADATATGGAPLLRRATAETIPRDAGSALPLVLQALPTEVQPVLAPEVADQIADLILERREPSHLAALGIEPTRTVLLSGPPGVGKTMTAQYIAGALNIPLVTIDLATIMSSYLGRTGQNLRAALDYGRSHDVVVLLDEFDALAKRRDDDSDIGELKRLVNILLLELERWPATSLLVAATNHQHLLDPAIERRFDVTVSLELPDLSQRREILLRVWPEDDLAETAVELVADLCEGLSGSDLTRLARAAARTAALRGRDPLHVLIENSVAKLGSNRNRDHLIRHLHDRGRLSNREIARLVGVTHPTVTAALRRTERGDRA